MFEWLKKFNQEPDPLAPLGLEPRFFDLGEAPAGSVTVSIQNDDETSLEFVVQVLNEYFGFKLNKAVEIAMKVHEDGNAAIRVMNSSDADHVVSKVRQQARNRGFPLNLTISLTVRN